MSPISRICKDVFEHTLFIDGADRMKTKMSFSSSLALWPLFGLYAFHNNMLIYFAKLLFSKSVFISNDNVPFSIW